VASVKRFVAQNVDPVTQRCGVNWVQEFDSLEQAQTALNGVWDAGNPDAHQEIVDVETGESWVRPAGVSRW
jgi:hypothetical protein